jgi:hypothetical protein
MSEGTLFNPGFLGASFNWWIGQIADDSTWRDNSVPGKFESKDQVPGWGKRYKVRIIGLHDKEEASIPSDQLPWAQVMYPITAGGGQGNSAQTANLRQGMFVFGFFLDGQDQQVPVIMGILGNNAQTALKTSIGTDDSNFAPTSGYANGKNPPSGTAKPRVPDEGLVISKPKPSEQSQECSPAPAGVKVNKYGLRADKPLTKPQFADQQSALAEAESKGLTGSQKDDFVQQKVAEGIAARCQAANSPAGTPHPGATKENADAFHEASNADVKRQEAYIKKTVMMSPCNMVESAMKSIQTAIENLTAEINKVLNAALYYIDAVSSKIQEIKALIANFACEIAKYLKIIFDKIMEYVLKQIHKALVKTVPAVPPNRRYQYADIKEQITELICCLYRKITNNLCGQIEKFLNDQVEQEKAFLDNDNNVNSIQMCSVEDMVGSIIGANMNDMTSGLDDTLKAADEFLADMQKYLAQGSSALANIKGSIDGLSGSIAGAMNFDNLKIQIFGCDLKPNCPASDYYTIQSGGAGQPQSQIPNPTSVSVAAANPKPVGTTTETPFAQPTKDSPKVTYK